ncbi:hypothetical protein EDB80DRAFT_411600 [Ilyonectria destructans]|nr:hypothetical protein EDB80DRAFT_411600 [Ilyonectria destructans]
MGNARLRTKTGCLNCRKRKVKCGEERPSCRNCSTSRRQCDWPSSADLRDRRNLPRKSQGHVSPGSPGSAISSEDPECRGDAPPTTLELTLSTSLNTAASAIRSEVEVELIYHFLNKFFSLLVLPTWNKTYFLEYQFQLVSMMMHCDSVKYAVLASCAANKCILSNDRRYQHHALVYYSRAVRGVNQAVLQLHSRQRVPDDSLLATVVFLYLHDMWGLDTVVDPRKHVAGAIKLLNLRYNDESCPLSMSRPFDRLTAESVLYQAFLLASRRPFSPNFHVDGEFLDNTENILDCKKLIDALPMDSYPVLGIPLPLFRHILDIINFYNLTQGQSSETLIQLRLGMNYWEAEVFNPNVMDCYPPLLQSFYSDTVTLYVHAASLLLDWITDSYSAQPRIDVIGLLDRSFRSKCTQSPRPWQLDSALSILRQPNFFETWSRCFIGAWPMLIFGYAVSIDDDIRLIRDVLRRTRQRVGYGEMQRIWDELELRWA